MRVLSIHSHKGGAGKTSLALMIAKAQALADKKVCAIDLDFIGSGFERLVDVGAPNGYLHDYVTLDPRSRKLPKIEGMIRSYRDSQMGKRAVDLIFNSADSTGSSKISVARAVRTLVGLAPRQDIIARAARSLLSELVKRGYDLVILDCHPGLVYLSESLLSSEKKTAGNITFFSFPSRTVHISTACFMS